MTQANVLPSDRVAAADAVKAYRGQKNGDWQQRIRDGLCDDGEMVQAFARHRDASVRELVEALEIRDKACSVCPYSKARTPSSAALCKVCSADASEPCRKRVIADAEFVDAARAALASAGAQP